MRPCDCKDNNDVRTELTEQGIAYNDSSIIVRPLSVILKVGPCWLRISQTMFKRFAEWYLEDQNKETK